MERAYRCYVAFVIFLFTLFVFVMVRNFQVNNLRVWMIYYSVEKAKSFNVYNNDTPSYGSMLWRFWIPLNSFKKDFINKVNIYVKT